MGPVSRPAFCISGVRSALSAVGTALVLIRHPVALLGAGAMLAGRVHAELALAAERNVVPRGARPARSGSASGCWSRYRRTAG